MINLYKILENINSSVVIKSRLVLAFNRNENGDSRRREAWLSEEVMDRVSR